MSWLVVHELGLNTGSAWAQDELSHTFTTGADNLSMYAVALRLYRHSTPSGTISVELRDASGGKIDASSATTITDIGSGNYWHGYYRFLLDVGLRKNTTYQLVLTSSGYTFQESAYVGWCNDFGVVTRTHGYSPAQGVSGPLDFKLWVREKVTRGLV